MERVYEKRWFCNDKRSLTGAVDLLQNNQVIAIPTDTVYGLAALAQCNDAIDSLYAIKNRNETKPLAICVSNVCDIEKWGIISHLPQNLLDELLPGPVTIVVRRAPALNPYLNPGMMNIGIRVPDSNFIRQVVGLIGEPLVLTSANKSEKPSSLKPEEFSELWPYLGGIFYDVPNFGKSSAFRAGSTVVDLTRYGKYKILREGMAMRETVALLNFSYKLMQDNT